MSAGTTASGPPYVGAPLDRREDLRFLTGRGTYVDDLALPGMLHMDVLRSPHAHAIVRAIDTSRARALPGVTAVFAGADLEGIVPALPSAGGLPGLRSPVHHALATDRVRFVGDAVAVVVASDRYAARDARDAIDVDYEPLPAVTDPERALDHGAPLVHEELGTNRAFQIPVGADIEGVLADCPVVVRQRMVNQRLIPNPMETRGIVAHLDPATEELTLWLSTQAPQLVRMQLAELLRFPEQRLRVIAPDVGGAFGAKNNPYAEEVLAAVLSLRLRRPVKWIEERQESMLATSHGRGQIAHVSLGADRDGRVRALHLRIVADMGAFLHVLTPMGPFQTAALMTGAYRIEHARADIVGVFTNATPVDPYRGFGRAEAAYYIERAMDLLARELTLDPVEVRRQNFVPPDAFPYAAPTGHVYEAGDHESCLQRALQRADYGGWRTTQQTLRARGRYLGIGVSTFTWRAGFPSVPQMPGLPFLKAGWERATVRVDPSGAVTVLTGTSPHGQGIETAFAQIAADALGAAPQDVRVLHSDTKIIPFGNGTMGSRSLAVGGSAVQLAADRVREKAIRIAAHTWKAEPDEIRFEGGRFFARGTSDRALTLGAIADLAYRGEALPEGMEPCLEATAHFRPANFTSPFGTHVCVVEVDVETGDVRILRYVAVDDCGRAVNPRIVEGQIHGGVAQGIGQALLEGAAYDDAGQPLAASFLTYATPTAADLPSFDVELHETTTRINPLGARGAGEGGTVGAPPAVVNAVVDALAPLGIRHIDMPLLPVTVWRAIREARGEGDG